MKLTNEQLAQCLKEFEKKFDGYYEDKECIHDNNIRESAWIGFQAAWRPIPSVEEIAEALDKNTHIDDYVDSEERAYYYGKNYRLAKAIHRAFGGKNHE